MKRLRIPVIVAAIVFLSASCAFGKRAQGRKNRWVGGFETTGVAIAGSGVAMMRIPGRLPSGRTRAAGAPGGTRRRSWLVVDRREG